MRPRRSHKAAWLLCTFLLLAQALLPVSAVAFVSVRCAHAPASARACAEAVLPAVDGVAAGTHPAAMACCLHMSGRGAMMDGMQSAPVSCTATQSALPCVVSVSVLGSDRPAAASSVRAWMFPAVPACASPAAVAALRVCAPTVAASSAPFALPPGCSAQAHGLRAPPVF